MKKTTAIFVGILVIIGAISILSNKIKFGKTEQTSVTTATKDLPVIILGAAPPSSNDLAARVMKKMNWDKESGFRLELRGVAPEVAVPAISGGTVDIIGMTPLTAIRSIQPEKPIVIIANGNIVSCPFFVNQSSPAQKWEDLKGKRLGTTAEAGPSYNMTKIAMKVKEGIDIDKEFQVSHSPFQELIPRLVRGEIDGAIGRCGEVGIAKAIEEAKFKVIGNLTDILYKDGDFDELMMESMISTRDWSNEHPELAMSFRKALYKTYAYIKDHPEVFDDPDIQKAYALDKADPAVITKIKDLVPTFYTFVSWPAVVDSQYKFFEVAKQEGLLDILPPKEELFFNYSN